MKNNKRVIESNAEAISLSPELRVLVAAISKNSAVCARARNIY